MSDKPMSQFLTADIFLKSAIVEKNPDMSFREAAAEYFGVSPEEITKVRRAKDASGWDITMEDMYEPSQEEEDYRWDLAQSPIGIYQWDRGPEDWEEEAEESEWMSPKDMGIAQKMDWSDDEGNEISDEQKLEYFKSRDDMYEVDDENGLVRLRPEEDWFEDDDDQEDWEREGYRNEIAYQNRWRDYTEPEEEMDDAEEDYRRDPYSPWNY